MNNLKKYLCLSAAAVSSSIATSAQTVIDFETAGYASLGVYDTWEESPFRLGTLKGNVGVVDNYLKEAEVNETNKMLGIQRSRFGSNTFGAKIDLNQVIEVTPTAKYLHVMMYKPVDGRVMLIGLGKRSDRAEQSNQVEQLWSYPVNDVKTGEWFDAVFPVKGNTGVELHSIVIVPHCEAPHTLSEDFVAYIDQIELNDSNRPRTGLGDYPVNFSTDAAWGRTDRVINGVTLNGSADGNQTISIGSSELKGYTQSFGTVFKAKAGNTVTANVDYKGEWMHTYVYLDRGQDGDFSYGVDANDCLDTNTDLVSYSLYRSGTSGAAHNSSGNLIYESNNGFNRITAPSFTIPSDMKPDIYRMRYKIDWNNIDPGGNIDSQNNILSNGGGIVDVLLNIHGDEITVNQDNRNGDVLIASTGNPVSGDKLPFGEALKIKMRPANGFTYNGIRVRHGYNFSGAEYVKGNRQYRDDFFYIDDFGADDTFTIPAEVMDGDVLIEGLFVEAGTGVTRKTVTYNIEFDGRVIDTQTFSVASGQAYPVPAIESEASEEYYSFAGIPEGVTTDKDEVFTLTLVQTLPFEVSRDHANAYWYNMTLTADKCYLTHNPSAGYISLGASTSAVPAENDYNSQWAFVGNVLDGFTIINRGAGEGKILSSSQAVTSSNDGTVYPVMTAVPVPENYNTYWMPTVGSVSVGKNAFYLHQLGHVTHCMNSRDERLAYWVGGTGAGSTFLATLVDTTSGLGSVWGDDACAPVEYFNLQGVKVDSSNLTPGIYVRRQGSKIDKCYVR